MPQRNMNRPLRIEWAGAGTGTGAGTEAGAGAGTGQPAHSLRIHRSNRDN